ncbi:MAG: hypothetical protein LBL15_02405 [Oscillospiraceae bacterium]|jgi:hypothetical protein|nr:hypothetical protein [Oscillospiraceae bacterium]
MLRRAVSTQINLMFRQKPFVFCFGINMIYSIATFIFYALSQRGSDVSTILSPNAAFALNSNAVFYPVFINLVPCISVLPFAMSFMTDQANEISPIIQSRTGLKNYYLSKMTVCFIGGFIVFFIPLAANMLLNLSFFPQSGITTFGDMFDRNYAPTIAGSNIVIDTIQSGVIFPRLFLYSADLYNLVFALIFSLSMGVLSVLNLAVSFIIKRYKILLFIPVYLLIILINTLNFLLQKSKPFINFIVMSYLTVNADHGKSLIFISAFFIAVIGFSIGMLILQISKDQI